MSANEVNILTRMANVIGQPGFVKCSYEFCSRHRRFEWVFRRHGFKVGCTVNKNSVLQRAQKLSGNYEKCNKPE